ncbi:response regulator [Propionispira arboris]|uniref:response regulator n=1 Tax=Propionispira arboris TaxID=84035 RepID=UPI001FE19342|nr:response regulator [Propionispira arboris]
MILTRKLKILITDDSLLLRRKLKQELESLDCEVFEAKNGKEAVMMYLENQPDGTFLDIVMPEVGGLEALKAIRKINEKAQVIMLSSTGTSSKLVETLKFGAIDFIQKPYTTQQIKKTLDDIRKKVETDA